GKNGADGTIKEDCRVGEKPNPWKLKWDSDELRMKAYYESSKVINLRSQHPAFFTDKTVTIINSTASIDKPRRLNIKYRPDANDENAEEAIDIIVMANFSAEMEIMTSGDFTQTGIWYNYMTGEQIQVKRTNKTITLQPGELIILTSRPVENKVAIEEVTNNENGCIIYPTITNDLITVVSATTPAYINVYSLSGNTVATAQDTDVISLANLTKGTYLVQVQVEDKVSVHKIIKQ
ncbi:MAG: T9SS type A sorting domain-containing protein, partial [Paludibacteraceae bacterium]|nr:T9SS type A sorting domain-containing protein [Paludibacteraceae bacterium]